MCALSRFQSSYWLLVFVIYFMVHALIRTAMGWKLTAEELQLVRDTQEFAWIYGSEMPLYVWLQSAVFDHFGVSVTTLALVKNGIMLLLCLSIFNLVQRVANASWALAATVSLLFIPQIAWTSQHALSSPVLATLMAATTALAFSSLERRPDLIRYITFGALIGLGALSSIYYLFLPVALILSALTAKPFRGLILNWRFLVTTIVAVGVAGRTYSEYLGVMGIPFDAASIVPTSRDALLGRAIDMYSVLQTALTFEKKNAEAAAQLRADGVTLYAWSDEDLQAFRNAAQATWPEFATTDEAKALVSSHLGYLKQLGLVAE